KSSIWVRPLSALDPYPLPGTEGATRPFWSPDSKYLAFFAERKLKKVPAAGGPAQLICETNGSDGSWGKGGTILYDFRPTDTIVAGWAAGGQPVPASFRDRAAGETGHAGPEFLPDGRHFLFLSGTSHGPGSTVLKEGALGSKKSAAVGLMESRAEYTASGRL